MFRHIASAIFLGCLPLICSTLTVAQSSAGPDQVCSGYFARFLEGYTIGQEEIDSLLHDDQAIATCSAQLDPSNADHQLIDALIKRRRKTNADETLAAQLFDNLCKQGNQLGCAYKTPWSKPGLTPARDAQEIARLKTLNGDLPVVNTMTGYLMATSNPGPEEREMALRLLRRGSEQGDYWATYQLALLIAMDGNKQQALALLRKGAEQGLVASWLTLADRESVTLKDKPAAFALFMRAAAADPKFFRPSVAHAQFMVGRMLRDGEGVERNLAEAQHWLESAARFGNIHAQRALEKK